MTMIKSALASPGITIKSQDQQDFNEINNSITRIKNTFTGKTLLDQIESYVRYKSGKHVIINSTMSTTPTTFAFLTPGQAQKKGYEGNRTSYAALDCATAIAVSGRFLKSEGTSASIYINRFMDVMNSSFPPLNNQGHATHQTTDGALANQLIKALHILKGTSLNDGSEWGKDNEELRALGTTKYAGETITENNIRTQMGLPMRAYIPESAIVPSGSQAFQSVTN